MKALFLHVYQYRVEAKPPCTFTWVGSEDDTGEGNHGQIEEMRDGIVVLFQIEEGDGQKQVRRFTNDVAKLSKLLASGRIMLAPFCHLSSSKATDEVSFETFSQIKQICSNWEGCEVQSSHFGWEKDLMLHVKPHSGAVRYREY